jgi:hypothetical protein
VGSFTSTNSHRALGNNDNVARELRLLEPSGSGVNYTALKAQAQAGDLTYTLPNTAPTAANQVLQVQAVAGNNATLSWGTIGGGSITFSFTERVGTAGSNNYAMTTADDIFGVDLSAGANYTVTLPPATTRGKVVIIKMERGNTTLLPFITVLCNAGTDRIDGATSTMLTGQSQAKSFFCDGAGNWYGF